MIRHRSAAILSLATLSGVAWPRAHAQRLPAPQPSFAVGSAVQGTQVSAEFVLLAQVGLQLPLTAFLSIAPAVEYAHVRQFGESDVCVGAGPQGPCLDPPSTESVASAAIALRVHDECTGSCAFVGVGGIISRTSAPPRAYARQHYADPCAEFGFATQPTGRAWVFALRWRRMSRFTLGATCSSESCLAVACNRAPARSAVAVETHSGGMPCSRARSPARRSRQAPCAPPPGRSTSPRIPTWPSPSRIRTWRPTSEVASHAPPARGSSGAAGVHSRPRRAAGRAPLGTRRPSRGLAGLRRWLVDRTLTALRAPQSLVAR